MKIGFERTNDNSNLYIKIEKCKDILLSEIFVDDIIFGGKDALCKDFANQMKHEFKIVHQGDIENFWTGRLKTCEYTYDNRT